VTGACRALITSTPVLAVVLWFVWGGTFLAIKVGLELASPAALGLLRTVSATAVIAAVLVARPHAERRVLREPAVAWRGALLGLTNVAGLLGFTHYAMLRADAGFSAVVVYAQPFLVALVAHYAFDEPLTSRRTLGLVVGWLGVAAVVGGRLFEGRVSVGTVALLLGAAMSWTVGTLLFKRLPRGVPVWPVLLWQNAVGTLPFLLVMTVEEPRVTWGLPLLLVVLVAGVGAGVAGFGLQFVLLRRGAASVVGSWIFAVPVVSTVLSVAFLDEPAGVSMLVGIVSVAAGIYLVNRPSRRAAASPVP
jgi:drug/metabolite transporter (DMT)-like permease